VINEGSIGLWFVCRHGIAFHGAYLASYLLDYGTLTKEGVQAMSERELICQALNDSGGKQK
jgi:hypothetical protein